MIGCSICFLMLHPVCFGEADEGDPNFLRFGDYNGATNGGNYHVIFVDMAASW